MFSARWVEKRRPHWNRLEQLSGRAAAGVRVLPHAELRELSLLYRQVAADLATVREDPSGRQMTDYLNRLLGRAHNAIYSGAKPRGKSLLRFYLIEYPQVFRQTFSYTFAAFLLFFVAAVAGLLLVLSDPSFAQQIIGPHMIDTIARRQMWTHSVVGIRPLAASGIMTNNLSVSFTTFAMGITFGLGTIYMLLFNGLLIGVIGAACWQAQMSLSLWSFVAPHGVLELPAIFIAGGAGLMLARGILFPGMLPRKESLAFYGAQAIRLVLGIIPLLIVAGTVEGFISPSDLPVKLKFALAAALFGCLIYYLGALGRQTVQESCNKV
jgi:uncharacterized membrane protein SpoIIM required for sporulation